MANLNDLTNEQREQHRQAVCVSLGLDPNPALGHLDYIWMPQENGMNNLVLYARRGTTELLRDINGIDVKSLDQHDGPGYVSFKATAVNKKGRQEIAVGAHETEGLKGKKLADGIATAQTRALRRVTLQFAGHGILDESEVNVSVVNSIAPAASQAALVGSPAVMPPPQTAPSTAPGKDITPNPLMDSLAESLKKGVPLVNQGENIAKVYQEGAAALAAMPVPKAVIPDYLDAQNPQNQGDSLQNVAGAGVQTAKGQALEQENLTEPKRQYRSKNKVNISSPGQESVPPATANETEQGAIGNGHLDDSLLSPKTAQLEKVAPPPLQPILVAPQPAVAPTSVPPPATMSISKEKQEEYRSRMSKYYNDILPRGGMQSSENIGGPTMKTRKFAAIHTGVADTKQMTEQHWEDFFEFLDANASNPKFLVDYINKALGVA